VTLNEWGAVVAIAATLAGIGTGVFRHMLKSHEDVCTERWTSLKDASHEKSKRDDERHYDNQRQFIEVKQSQTSLATVMGDVARTVAVLAERTKAD
jgi:hypothetical protein